MERQDKQALAPSPERSYALSAPEIAALRQFLELLDEWDRKEKQDQE